MTDTILVVDDEPLLLIDLSEQLRAAGFAVIEAACGGAAKSILQNGSETGARIDLVVTDVRMPGAPNGIELARWIRASSNLPVILVSGELTGRDVPDVADARFTKPIDVARLIETIERLIRDRDVQSIRARRDERCHG